MGNFKRNYNRFLIKNRNKGIPNIILWVMLGNVLVYLFTNLTYNTALVEALAYYPQKIASGQIWRMVTYIFTYSAGYVGSPMGLFFVALTTYFYYWLGKMVENIWGSLRLNFYFFSGILLTSLCKLLVDMLLINNVQYLALQSLYTLTPYYVLLSLFLAVATLAPEQRVLVFFVIPVKMRWMALVDLGLILYSILSVVFQAVRQIPSLPIWTVLVLTATAPVVSFLNYALFFRGDVRGLFTSKPIRKRQPRARAWEPEQPRRKGNVQDIPRQQSKGTAGSAKPYRHKCTVCGRTDTDCPGLEFRYCSKCAGYFCYCIDHINNHTHIQ